MTRFSLGRRVLVHWASGHNVNLPGRVVRLCHDGTAWVELDQRCASDLVHAFAASDPIRARWVRAAPEHCSLESGAP